jgi:hypothetical protein
MMENQPNELPPELAALEAQAREIEPPPVDPENPTAPAPQPVDFTKEARGIINVLSDSLGAIYPTTKNVLVDPARDELAKAWAPVMEQFDFSLGRFLGRYGNIIGAAYVTAQFAIPVAEAIRHDKETQVQKSGLWGWLKVKLFGGTKVPKRDENPNPTGVSLG